MSTNLIDVLLDTLDSIDKGTQATQIQKETIVITLGFNKMGDKNPITLENIKAWSELREDYLRTLRNDNFSDSIRILLLEATFDLISRCFTSENAEALFDKLCLRWKL